MSQDESKARIEPVIQHYKTAKKNSLFSKLEELQQSNDALEYQLFQIKNSIYSVDDSAIPPHPPSHTPTQATKDQLDNHQKPTQNQDRLERLLQQLADYQRMQGRQHQHHDNRRGIPPKTGEKRDKFLFGFKKGEVRHLADSQHEPYTFRDVDRPETPSLYQSILKQQQKPQSIFTVDQFTRSVRQQADKYYQEKQQPEVQTGSKGMFQYHFRRSNPLNVRINVVSQQQSDKPPVSPSSKYKDCLHKSRMNKVEMQEMVQPEMKAGCGCHDESVYERYKHLI